jgi:hypothetical protein
MAKHSGTTILTLVAGGASTISLTTAAGYPGDGAIVLGWIDAWLDTIADAVAALEQQRGAV